MIRKSDFPQIAFIFVNIFIVIVSAKPTEEREPRQVNLRQKPDGTIVASFSAANAVNVPGMDNSFALSETFEFGPKGSSSSSSTAFNSGVNGNRMSFSNSQAQNSRMDPFGGGFSNSASNAASNSFSNPMFSSSNAQANAFANQFGGAPGFGR